MSEPTCKTCRFWKPAKCDPDNLDPGTCRRYPPGRSSPGAFPETYAETWCGEHRVDVSSLKNPFKDVPPLTPEQDRLLERIFGRKPPPTEP